MKNVERLKIPKVLEKNAAWWTEELLVELRQGGNEKRVKALQKKYAHREIRETLKRMYKFCCYCESGVRHVTVDHIEHRKPKAKDKFPECTFEWDNLHLACPNCNGAKLDKWDADNSILDAVTDVPISEHLLYREYYRHPVTMRGKTTRDHADLNREELLEARQIVYWDVMDIVEEYNNDPEAPGSDIAYTKLAKLSKGQYGSLVEYLMKTFMRRRCG